MGPLEIHVLRDDRGAARAAAVRIASLVEAALAERDRCSIALSGGSTPRKLHAELASPALSDRIEWGRLAFYWGDERCVPPSHEASNYRMARETLLDRVPLDEAQIHRIRGEIEPAHAAQEYEDVLRASLATPEPRFDLLLLGLGEDGHTASLFPGRPELDELARLVVPVIRPTAPPHRVSLTLSAINAAGCVLFLVTGARKAEAVARVLGRARRDEGLPAARVRPASGRVLWFLDSEAAGTLSGD